MSDQPIDRAAVQALRDSYHRLQDDRIEALAFVHDLDALLAPPPPPPTLHDALMAVGLTSVQATAAQIVTADLLHAQPWPDWNGSGFPLIAQREADVSFIRGTS